MNRTTTGSHHETRRPGYGPPSNRGSQLPSQAADQWKAYLAPTQEMSRKISLSMNRNEEDHGVRPLPPQKSIRPDANRFSTARWQPLKFAFAEGAKKGNFGER